LKGKNLICGDNLKYLPCHCDIILEIANEKIDIIYVERQLLYIIDVYINNICGFISIDIIKSDIVMKTNGKNNFLVKNQAFKKAEIDDIGIFSYYFKFNHEIDIDRGIDD
jgi:hypothetical protein